MLASDQAAEPASPPAELAGDQAAEPARSPVAEPLGPPTELAGESASPPTSGSTEGAAELFLLQIFRDYNYFIK